MAITASEVTELIKENSADILKAKTELQQLEHYGKGSSM